MKLTRDRYKHTWEITLIKNEPAVFEDKDVPYFVPKPGFEKVASLTVPCDRPETLKDIARTMYRNYIDDHGGERSDNDDLPND